MLTWFGLRSILVPDIVCIHGDINGERERGRERRETINQCLLRRIPFHCIITVEPPIMDPLRGGQPLYKGQASGYGLDLA